MGHHLTGFIVDERRTLEIASEHPQLRGGVRLNNGLALFVLSGDSLDRMCPDVQAYPFQEFTHLCADLANLLMKLSRSSAVLYFETDYHGGRGSQAAILFREGHVVFGPEQHSGNERPKLSPVSEALERMGVRVESPDVDAFEAVGLSRYRNEDALDPDK